MDEYLSQGIIEHSNSAPYSVQQSQGVAAVILLETEGKSNIWCRPCPLEYYFCVSDTTLGRSPVVQQEECSRIISAITVLNTLPK